MSRQYQRNDWDFTPVLDLIHSLSTSSEDNAPYKAIDQSLDTSLERASNTGTPTIIDERESELGNFDKIWDFLRQPFDVPAPKLPIPAEAISIRALKNNGTLEQTTLKEVKWRDKSSSTNIAGNDEPDASEDVSLLTKAQWKKARRKRRSLPAEVLTNKDALSSSSENQSALKFQTARATDRRFIISKILQREAPVDNQQIKHPIDPGAWPATKPHAVNGALKALKSPSESAHAVAATRKSQLMRLINEKFIDERQCLKYISHMQCDHAKITQDGIHVFVDASNIMIGFHDALRVSRKLSLNQRMRRQPFSFHSLSLILTRGRPTAKLVLVGSDNFPAIQEAKQIGYETNILDRVHKAKELTPRQKKYNHVNYNSGGKSTAQSAGSGSETIAVQYAAEKWVEQAVDEILHLKMMESVVDASKPSTMVLATGDAAEAEYSGGFLRMVDRALCKGWKVELTSFRRNISGAYRDRDFRKKWGDHFKIVELDDFVEVLLGAA